MHGSSSRDPRFLYPIPDEQLALIRHEVSTVPVEKVPDGSGNTGWIHGLTNGRLYGPGWPDLLGWTHDVTDRPDNIFDAVTTLYAAVRRRWGIVHGAQLRQVMVNHLASGGRLDAHADGPPADLRFHLPVFTNSGVHWWDERRGFMTMPAGVWCGPVDYSGVMHSMVNLGFTARTHIICDFYIGG